MHLNKKRFPSLALTTVLDHSTQYDRPIFKPYFNF